VRHGFFKVHLSTPAPLSDSGVREDDFGVETGWRRSRRPQLSKSLICESDAGEISFFIWELRGVLSIIKEGYASCGRGPVHMTGLS